MVVHTRQATRCIVAPVAPQAHIRNGSADYAGSDEGTGQYRAVAPQRHMCVRASPPDPRITRQASPRTGQGDVFGREERCLCCYFIPTADGVPTHYECQPISSAECRHLAAIRPRKRRATLTKLRYAAQTWRPRLGSNQRHQVEETSGRCDGTQSSVRERAAQCTVLASPSAAV